MREVIPLFKPYIGQEEKEAACRVIDSRILSRGSETDFFEAEFAAFVGAKYAVAVSSGTAGLHLAIKTSMIPERAEVITTPFTFIATANSLLYENIKPVFVDINQDDFTIDTIALEKAITKDTKGILPVHLFGNLAQMEEIERLAKKHSLQVIEDSCQSIFSGDATLRPSNTHASVYGFFANKQLSIGEGGMVTTNSADTAKAIRSLRDQGRSVAKDWINFVVLGYNYRMTELQAAVGRAQLEKLPFMLNRRLEVAAAYRVALTGLKNVAVVANPANHKSEFIFPILCKSSEFRTKLSVFLSEKGIQTQVAHPPLHYFLHFRALGYKKGDFPVAEDLAARLLFIPLFVELSSDDQAYIVNTIRTFDESYENS